jgi:hypothetical protein
MDDLLSLYTRSKPPQAAGAAAGAENATGGAAAAAIATPRENGGGIVPASSPRKAQASEAQERNGGLHDTGSSEMVAETVAESQPCSQQACDAEEELEQVMQTLAGTTTKAPPLSVKRRRSAGHALTKGSGGTGADRKGASPSSGGRQTAMGGGGGGAQCRTPQTTARDRKSAPPACMAGQLRRRGRVSNGSPRKMLRRGGRRVARDASSDEEGDGCEDSESDEPVSQEVTYSNQLGQEKLQELVGRLPARGRAQASPGRVGVARVAAAEPAQPAGAKKARGGSALTRRSSRSSASSS